MLMPVFRGEKSQPYVQQFRWTFKEAIDWEEEKWIWQKILKRYDAFYFSYELDKKWKVKAKRRRRLQVDFSTESWSRFSKKRKDSQLKAFLETDLKEGFSASRKALCRFHCIRMNASHYELIITSHHAIIDGRSRRILIEDYFELKNAKQKSNGINEKTYPKFEDYLNWQHKQSWKQSRDFWSQQLNTFEEATTLEIGYDCPPRVSASGFGSFSKTIFSSSETKHIHRLSKSGRHSLNIVAQATWGILLSSFSGKEKVVFAAPRACRKSSIENSEKLVGLLLNTVPVVIEPKGDCSTKDYLELVAENWTAIRPHEHTPYRVLKEASSTPPKEPLFNSYLSYENYQLEDLVSAEAQSKYRFSINWFNEVPFSLNIQDGNSIRADLTFDKSKYTLASVKQLVETFRTVFKQLLVKPNLLLRDIQLLNKADRSHVLKLSTGKRPSLKDKEIHKAFERIAEKHASKTAIRFEGSSLSYKELNERANQLSRLLREEGLKRGMTVALYFERNINAIIAQLAVLKAGGIFVPLIPTHPKDRHAWILKNSNPTLILTDSKLDSTIRSRRIKKLNLDNLGKRLDRFSTANLNLILPENPTAYIMYTSGSTGRPKGVVVPHAGIVRLVQKIDYATLNTKTRALQLTALSFDLSTFEIWGPLLNGGACILYPGEEPDFLSLKEIVQTESINTMLLSASVFNSIIDEDPSILKGVKQLVIGAEALSPRHVHKSLRLLPELRLINGYGPTEASALNNCLRIPRSQSPDRSVPIGPPIEHSTSYIFDKEDRLLPPGIPGELMLGGIGLAAGYQGNSKQTKERFVINPLGISKDPLLYRTSDRAFMHGNGNFDYIERFDDQLKIRGHRIEPGDIRAQILRIKECGDCHVMAVKNHRSEDELRAFVALENNKRLSAAELKASISTSLPPYMIPESIVFMDSLPLNSNGKVDRKVLADIKVSNANSTKTTKGQQTKTQRAIVALWKELLGKAPTHLDLDFFEAGGHSLLATSLIFRIQRQFNSRIPFTVFDSHSTVRSLAHWIDHEKSDSKQADGLDPLILKPLKFEDTTDLGLKWRTFCIPDIKNPDEVHSLLITRAVILNGDLNPKLLSQAMEQVINANERLRSYGSLINGKCFEKVEKSIRFNLPEKDLSHLPEAKALKIAKGIFRRESIANMSMRYAPQIRLQLLKLAKHKYFLSFVIQHAVADGYAVEMFYKQTSKAYNRLLAKNRSKLRPSKFSYREFENQLEAWLKNGNEVRIKSFWKKQLRNIKPIPYPFLVKNVPQDISWNQLDHYWFTASWKNKVKAFCRERKISTFTFFSTIIKVLIARYTGQFDSYYTSAVNGRTGQQQEDIFGDFACTIMVRTKLSPRKSFVELAEAEATKLFTCLDHKYISVNGLDAPHDEQVDHPHSPFGQLQVIEGADTGDSLQLSGVKSKFLMRTKSGALARLGFVVRETKHSLQITFAYAPMIFVPHSIDRLKFNFQSFVELVLENPNLTLPEFPNLTASHFYHKSLTKAEKQEFMFKKHPA